METIQNKQKDRAFKIFVGGILCLFGFATLHIYFGYFLLACVFVLLSYETGIEIDISNNSIRSFWSVFGKKNGVWKSMKQYNVVSVKKHKKGVRRYGTSLTSIDTSDLYYDVLLLNSTHLKTQLCLHSTKNKNEAKEQAHAWCEKLSLPYMHYGKGHSYSLID